MILHKVFLSAMVIAVMMVGVAVQAEEEVNDQPEESQVEEQTQEESVEDEEEKEDEEENGEADEEEEQVRGRPDHAGPPAHAQASERARHVQACLQVSRTLRQGSSGDEVGQLQQALMDMGYFDHDTITNYYGPITERAVQRFQESEGIVSEGDPDSTGFGLVGPRTREAFAKVTCLRDQGPTETDEDSQNGTDQDVDEEKTPEEIMAMIEDLKAQIEVLQAQLAESEGEEENGEDNGNGENGEDDEEEEENGEEDDEQDNGDEDDDNDNDDEE